MNTLELWPSLHKAALLGTARAGEALISPEDAPHALRTALQLDREGALLSLLAAASLARRAAVAPPALQDASSAASTCADDPRAIAPAAACRRLRSLAGSSEAPLLREWLEIARGQHFVAPHDALPALLRLGSRSKALRAGLLPVLGERGRWLAALNAQWAWARGEALDAEAGAAEAESAFVEGEGTARSEAFARLRALDCGRALQVLEDAWSSESASQRAQWIEMLQFELSSGDEEFLERALDDRSEAVRQMAAQVLAALLGSAFSRRAIERAGKYLSAQRIKGALHLESRLPAAWDKSWARDGIEENGAKMAAGSTLVGHRSWWLRQMLSFTPPSHWEAAWSADPDEILAAAHDEGALVEGLALAAVRARDSRWIMALLPLPAAAALNGLPYHFLLGKVEPAQRDALLCGRVHQVEQSLAEAEMNNLLGLLSSHAEPWSRELSQAVLDWMRALGRKAVDEGRLQNASQWQFPGGHLLHRAPQFAPLMHLDALARVDEGWPWGAPAFFENARLALRDAFEARNAMRREFES